MARVAVKSSVRAFFDFPSDAMKLPPLLIGLFLLWSMSGLLRAARWEQVWADEFNYRELPQQYVVDNMRVFQRKP